MRRPARPPRHARPPRPRRARRQRRRGAAADDPWATARASARAHAEGGTAALALRADLPAHRLRPRRGGVRPRRPRPAEVRALGLRPALPEELPPLRRDAVELERRRARRPRLRPRPRAARPRPAAARRRRPLAALHRAPRRRRATPRACCWCRSRPGANVLKDAAILVGKDGVLRELTYRDAEGNRTHLPLQRPPRARRRLGVQGARRTSSGGARTATRG